MPLGAERSSVGEGDDDWDLPPCRFFFACMGFSGDRAIGRPRRSERSGEREMEGPTASLRRGRNQACEDRTRLREGS